MLEFRRLILSPAQSFHDCLSSPGVCCRLSKNTFKASLRCCGIRFLKDENRDEFASAGLHAGDISVRSIWHGLVVIEQEQMIYSFNGLEVYEYGGARLSGSPSFGG